MTKTILIIGAGRGLGLQFSLQYLKREYNVYGTYRKDSADAPVELLESKVKTLIVDLADESSINDASRLFGDQPLDLLINCAASGNGSDKWFNTSADELMEKLRINAVGPFLVIKAFYLQLRRSTCPLVVNISSNTGSISRNDIGGNLSYRTSKAALNMITVDLSRELARDRISCVAISPGWVRTKISNYTGPLEADEAVRRMITVIDRLGTGDTASFYHMDGYQISW